MDVNASSDFRRRAQNSPLVVDGKVETVPSFSAFGTMALSARGVSRGQDVLGVLSHMVQVRVIILSLDEVGSFLCTTIEP